MTPKEKAEELLEKMNVIHHLKGNGLPVSMHKTQIKQCALIAVEELINLDYNSLEYYGILSSTQYWTEVKKEIKNI